MKFNISFALTLLLLSSCTKDEFSPLDWGPDPIIEITPLAVILTPSHPIDTVEVRTNYDYFSISKPYWVSITKIENTPAVIVSATDLRNDDFREGYVTIKVKRGDKQLSRDFVVLQFKDNLYE